jgi:hypothetical protein
MLAIGSIASLAAMAPAPVDEHGDFGGVSGSGKSGGLNVLMGNLSACTEAVIWAIDLQRCMELQPWGLVYRQAGHHSG